MRTLRRALKEVLLRGPLTRPLLLRAVKAVNLNGLDERGGLIKRLAAAYRLRAD
jgi:hypothetical protein